MAATLAKQIERQEKQVAKLEARGEKLAQKLMAKEDMNVAVQLAKEIDEQETKMIMQWNKDFKLAKQLSREEKVAANQASKAEAQVHAAVAPARKQPDRKRERGSSPALIICSSSAATGPHAGAQARQGAQWHRRAADQARQDAVSASKQPLPAIACPVAPRTDATRPCHVCRSEKLGNLRKGLAELTGNNGNISVSADKLVEPLSEP